LDFPTEPGTTFLSPFDERSSLDLAAGVSLRVAPACDAAHAGFHHADSVMQIPTMLIQTYADAKTLSYLLTDRKMDLQLCCRSKHQKGTGVLF
jgi:hypothetical protein